MFDTFDGVCTGKSAPSASRSYISLLSGMLPRLPPLPLNLIVILDLSFHTAYTSVSTFGTKVSLVNSCPGVISPVFASSGFVLHPIKSYPFLVGCSVGNSFPRLVPVSPSTSGGTPLRFPPVAWNLTFAGTLCSYIAYTVTSSVIASFSLNSPSPCVFLSLLQPLNVLAFF